PQPVAVGGGEPLPVHGRQRAAGPGEDVFQWGEQERKRGAEFVADVGEERGLRRVELCQRRRAAALLFEGPGARDRGCDLARDQIEEATTRLVEYPEIAEAGDQAARGHPLARLRDRQDESPSGKGRRAPGEARGRVLDEHGPLRRGYLPEGPGV